MPSAQPADLLVIDVRSAVEYASGHVEGALNVPLDRFTEALPRLVPDKQATMLLYCMSGARSGAAEQWLRQQGYQRVANGGSAGAVALQLQRAIRRL